MKNVLKKSLDEYRGFFMKEIHFEKDFEFFECFCLFEIKMLSANEIN
jgi:hypothetical protein